jgi:hypothetical protein
MLKNILLSITICLIFNLSSNSQNIICLTRDLSGAFSLKHFDLNQSQVINSFEIEDLSVVSWFNQSTLDPTKKEFYFVGYDANSEIAYYTINLETEMVEKHIESNQSVSFTEIDWNRNDSLVYGVRRISSTNGYSFGTLDFNDGQFNSLLDLNGVEAVYSGAVNAFDNTYILILKEYSDPLGEYTIYTIDINSNTISINVPCQFSSPTSFRSLIVNPLNSQKFGLKSVNTSGSNYDLYLSNLNASQGTINEIALLDTFKNFSAGEPALNYDENTVIFSGKFQSDSSSVNRMLVFDLSTGELVNQMQLTDFLLMTEYYDSKLSAVNELANSTINVSVYPNPSNGLLSVSSDIIMNRATVLDIRGRQVFSQSINDLVSAQLDLQHLSKGAYLLKIETDDGISVSSLILE